MAVRITTLVENSVPMGSAGIAEHGLSFYIETKERRILFDTGQGKALAPNSKILGIDPAAVDTVVLSHGHHDHAGGLPVLLTYTGSFTLFGHPALFSRKLSKTKEGFVYRGIPVSREQLEQAGVKLRLSRSPMDIAPGMKTSGEIPMHTDFESVADGIFLETEQGPVPDPLADDLCMAVKTDAGLVIVLGCTHRGLINSLDHLLDLTGERRIHAIVGGLHLGRASGSHIRRVIERLRDYDIERIGVCHCTGMPAILELSRVFGDRVFPNSVGQVLEF